MRDGGTAMNNMAEIQLRGFVADVHDQGSKLLERGGWQPCLVSVDRVDLYWYLIARSTKGKTQWFQKLFEGETDREVVENVTVIYDGPIIKEEKESPQSSQFERLIDPFDYFRTSVTEKT